MKFLRSRKSLVRPPRVYRSAVWFRRAALLPALLFCITNLIMHRYFWAGVNGFVVLLIGTIGETVHRRYLNEYRRTTGNRLYPGARLSSGTSVIAHGSPLARSARTFATFNPERTDPGVRTPEPAHLPIIAYKAAELAVSDERGPYLRSHFTSIPYDHYTDWAECHAGRIRRGVGSSVGSRRTSPGHEVPDLGCTCGFYAVNTFDMIHAAYGSTFGTVLMEVELFGKVIICQAGYRAQRQRILHIGIPPCALSMIAPESCQSDSDCLIVASVDQSSHPGDDYLLPVCMEHRDQIESILVGGVRGVHLNVDVRLGKARPLKTYSFEDISQALNAPVGHAREGF